MLGRVFTLAAPPARNSNGSAGVLLDFHQAAQPSDKRESAGFGDLEVILLPGLDGTGDLFEPLLRVLPPSVHARVISYPVDKLLSYDDLAEIVSEQMPAERPLALVAESFSGPLALRYASEHPDKVRAVVLCASFVSSPVPRWIARAASPLLFRAPLPSLGIRLLLLGWRAPASAVRAVRSSIKRVRPDVLAGRVREVIQLDCSSLLAECQAPILYLRADHDAIVRAKTVREIKAARPGVVIRHVSGPHLLLQAEPERAWQEMAEFLSRTSAAR